MKNIATRSISGIVYIALIVGSIMLGSPYFMALTAIFAILAVYEFHNLASRLTPQAKALSPLLVVDIAAAVSLVFLSSNEILFTIGAVALLTIYMVVRIVLALYDRKGHSLISTAMSAVSVLYIGLPLAIASALNYMGQGTRSLKYLMLIIFVMIWLNDTGAYCVGSLIGRHRLFERLSPKKSWEGFWGGMVFSAAAGVGGYYLCPGTATLPIWLGLGVTVSVFATWGDLFESLIKRTVSVKDSGNIMPGHGGILDRIDSLLLVAPAAAIYAVMTNLL